MIYEEFLIRIWSSVNTFTVWSAYFTLHKHDQMQKCSSWTCCCSSAGSWALKWEKLLLCSRPSCRFPEYLTAFQPPLSFHFAVGGRGVDGGGGRGGGFLWFASTMAQSPDLIRTPRLQTMENTRVCEPVHVTEPPLPIASHRNLQSVYSHRRGIMNSCSSRSIHLSCIH